MGTSAGMMHTICQLRSPGLHRRTPAGRLRLISTPVDSMQISFVQLFKTCAEHYVWGCAPGTVHVLRGGPRGGGGGGDGLGGGGFGTLNR
jgi:hypothetical protein